MATQLSRKRRSPDNKLTQLLWEPDDGYTLTDTDIDRGWFEHQLVHPRINYKLLVRCKVNAGEYAHTDMAVDETTGIVHVTLGGWETVDEYVRFQYYYRHGGRLVPAQPTPFEIVTTQITGGTSVFANGDPFSVTPITLSDGGREDYIFKGNYTDPDITGFKLVGEFSGNGTVFWDWYFESPDVAPLWPEPDRTDWSYVGLNNSTSWSPPGWEVNGSNQVFEHVFAVADTPSDPSYAGFSIASPLQDLLISLNAIQTGSPADYYMTYGKIDVFTTAGQPPADVTVHRLDLVLTGVHPA